MFPRDLKQELESIYHANEYCYLSALSFSVQVLGFKSLLVSLICSIMPIILLWFNDSFVFFFVHFDLMYFDISGACILCLPT